MQDLGSGGRRLEESAYACGGSPTSFQDCAPGRRAFLAEVIETRILPRLMLAHGRRPRVACSGPDRPRASVDELAELLLHRDAAPAYAHLDRLRHGGLDDIALMLEALAPAARRLGALWENDECDFVEVTIGVRRLDAMLRDLSQEAAFFPDLSARTLLLLSAPGETHRLGADMAAELFRRDGWDVERGDDHRLARLAERRFDAVGFSIACERCVAGLHEAIARAREISLNREICVLAGGQAFVVAPQLLRELDVDYGAADVEDAMLISRTLLERRELCRR